MRVAAIMAGGSGERFWPLSRRSRPKQLLALTSDKTMLAETVERARELARVEAVYLVVGRHLAEPIRQVLPDFPEKNLIFEPQGRNTGPCLAYAAAVIAARHGSDATMCALTADHLIEEGDAFAHNVDLACDVAEKEDGLVTLGIRPRHPDTGFGYLQLGPEEKNDPRGKVYRIAAFKEKPDLATAEKYVRSGQYLWNSGMFFCKTDRLMKELELHAPDLAQGAREISQTVDTPTFEATVERIFASWPSISIDYAVMEKAERVFGVAANFVWDDVGTWNSLARIRPLDNDGNLISPGNLVLNSKNCVIINDAKESGGKKPIIAALGVEDLVIVNTDDALLVCHRDSIQNIREILKALREEGKTEYL